MAGHRQNRLSLLDNELCTAFCAFERDFMEFRGKITTEKLFDEEVIQKAVFMEQIHSNEVLFYEPEKDLYTCDGLICSEANVALCVLSADCLPLLLWHKSGIIAALHSGRKGTFVNILSRAVLAINKGYESLKNDDFTLIIAPSICTHHYALSGELLNYAQKNFGEFLQGNLLDLKGIVKKQARDLGILDIKDCGICTFDDERFFSYRRNQTQQRFVSVIVLKGRK